MLPDYFKRSALAASQVLAGFDLDRFQARIEQHPVGLAVASRAATRAEGGWLADLTMRLLARLYPVIELRAGPLQAELEALARSIHPGVKIVTSGAPVGIAIGDSVTGFPITIYAGSNCWHALLGQSPQPVGEGEIPFGAGASACLAAGALFNEVFAPSEAERRDDDIRFSTWTGSLDDGDPGDGKSDARLAGDAVLVGVGAIGHGVLWALSKAPLEVTLHLVDPEQVELGNLQRYVMAERNDEGASKVGLAAATLTRTVRPVPHAQSWDDFVAVHGYKWHHVLVALDSARDRRMVQGALPEWIANAWTQPGDLGVSCHDAFDEPGACLACLYLPRERAADQDAIIAQALGVPQLVADVRGLLHTGAGVSDEFLAAVAAGLRLDPDSVREFAAQPVRRLYVEGVCGGTLIPMGQVGAPAVDVHVPLAHQSALAGVLLAAQLAKRAAGHIPSPTQVTRIDVLGRLTPYLTQPALKPGDGQCICEDPDYVAVFRAKYGDRSAGSGGA